MTCTSAVWYCSAAKQTKTNAVRRSLNASYCNDLLTLQWPGLSMADILRSIFIPECDSHRKIKQIYDDDTHFDSVCQHKLKHYLQENQVDFTALTLTVKTSANN